MLGNVVSAGIKVLVLAAIVGIGSAIFSDFHNAVGGEPSVDEALAIMLASLALLGLGIFGPGIATGLVSGGPQLGAGAAVGTAMGAAGLAVAGAAAVRGGMHLAAGRGATALRSASSLAAGARSTNVGGTTGSGSSGATSAAANRASGTREDVARGGAAGASWQAHTTVDANSGFDSPAAASPGDNVERAPPWARRLHRRAQLTHGIATAAHVVRASDHGGGGASPKLGEESA